MSILTQSYETTIPNHPTLENLAADFLNRLARRVSQLHQLPFDRNTPHPLRQTL